MTVPSTERFRGSHTPGNGCSISIDACRPSILTSHAAGKKSIHTFSNVYFTIWAEVGSTHRVTRAVLFIFRSMPCSSTSI